MIPAEGEIFAAWEKGARSYPWTAAQFLATTDSATSRTLVLDREKNPVAYAVAQIVGDEAYLLNIMARPDHRRIGAASVLLENMMVWAKEKGAKALLLDVDPANIPAVAFYTKAGFEILSRRLKSYPHGEDAFVMRKWL
jgi:ribosomal protein S18 acetylase RimI-like enzyme